MSTDPKFAYRESTARAATPVGRVILLYEQAIQDIGAAAAAIADNQVEQKTNKLGHALLVIGELQACLDLDRGGEVARNLERFYELVRKRLLDAQISNSATVLREQIDLLLSVRSAWIEVEQQSRQQAAVAAASSAEGPAASPGLPLRWRG